MEVVGHDMMEESSYSHSHQQQGSSGGVVNGRGQQQPSSSSSRGKVLSKIATEICNNSGENDHETEEQFQHHKFLHNSNNGGGASSRVVGGGKDLSNMMKMIPGAENDHDLPPSAVAFDVFGGGEGEGEGNGIASNREIAAAAPAAAVVVHDTSEHTDEEEDIDDDSNHHHEDDFDDYDDYNSDDDYCHNEFKDVLPANIRAGNFTAPSFAALVNDDPSLTKNIDSELAQEMNGLTLQQREKALHDVHGVNIIEENPQIVKKAIKELDTYLYSKRNSRQASAYALALSIDKSYVESDKLRLLFLRGHDMNAIEAGKMILHHFQLKKELFGDSKLCKDITQADLSPDDMACINNGHFQFLPVCEQGGRQVFIHFMGNEQYTCSQNLARSMWYIAMNGLNSLEAQQKGIVTVGWGYGGNNGMLPPTVMFTCARTKEALPIRQTCFHFCTNKEGISKYFMQFVRKYFMPTHHRIRTRLHFGNQSELYESVSGWGIPMDVFPLTESGELKRDRHHGWMKTQELIENAANKKNPSGGGGGESDVVVVSIPTQSDILLGRGKACQYHIGNMRFRLMLESQFDEYDKANKIGKSDMAYKLVEDVKSSGGRFLSMENGIWIQVSDLTARKKVSHRFRAIRGEKKTTTTTIGSSSSNNNNNNVVEQRRVEDSTEIDIKNNKRLRHR